MWHPCLGFVIYLLKQVTRPHLISTTYKVNLCCHVLYVGHNTFEIKSSSHYRSLKVLKCLWRKIRHFPKVIWYSKRSYFNWYRFWCWHANGLSPWVTFFPFCFLSHPASTRSHGIWIHHTKFKIILKTSKWDANLGAFYKIWMHQMIHSKKSKSNYGPLFFLLSHFLVAIETENLISLYDAPDWCVIKQKLFLSFLQLRNTTHEVAFKLTWGIGLYMIQEPCLQKLKHIYLRIMWLSLSGVTTS